MTKILFSALMIFSAPLWAAEEMDEIKNCLKNWKNHPFKSAAPEYRVIGSKVRVMGVGDELVDSNTTEKPELVFVKPTVNVMSKSTIRLLNPNGWYCLKNNVAVMGKTEIELDCKAHLAAAGTGTTVMGKDDSDHGNVTVMGKNTVTKINCANL